MKNARTMPGVFHGVGSWEQGACVPSSRFFDLQSRSVHKDLGHTCFHVSNHCGIGKPAISKDL